MEECAFELPETTKLEIIEKIKALAWSIRNDWSDPRGECRTIVKLCEKLKELQQEQLWLQSCSKLEYNVRVLGEEADKQA